MKTQFTLRQLFIIVAYFSAGFAVAAAALPLWLVRGTQVTTARSVIASIGPFVAMMLMGAGIGQLFGNVKGGVFGGLVFALFVFSVFGLGAILGWWY
jgi:hypothetical protein